MGTLRCVGANLTYLQVNAATPFSLAEDFESEIADFSDNSEASFQVVWDGNDQNTGTFELWLSNFEDPESFCRYPNSLYTMDPSLKSLGWSIPLRGFRFGRIYYRKGTVSTGTVKVVARAKKG